MDPSVQVFWVPKFGNSEEEYEDAYAFSLPDRCFAMADGATESSFADRWARSLVRQYTSAPPLIPPVSLPLPDWLTPLQREWHAGVPWETLPWFAEEKARSGAFATLLGLYFMGRPATPPKVSFWNRLLGRKPERPCARWHALALGDSCMFQVREGKLIHSFPMETAAAFSDRPLLISSNPARNSVIWKAVQFADGDALPGDVFLLGTDALSKWFLQQHEKGGRPWETLTGLKSQADFAGLVARLRESRALKNDDTTVLFFVWQDDEPETIAPGGIKKS